MILATLACAAVLIPLPSGQAPAGASERDHYEQFLRSVTKSEGISLIADVNLNYEISGRFPDLSGAPRLRAIAQMLNRAYVQEEGTVLFIRRPEDAYGSSRRSALAALEWLESLDERALTLLSKGALFTNDIPQHALQGVMEALSPDPDRLQHLLKPTTRAAIGAKLTLMVEVKNSETGEVQRMTVPVQFAPATSPLQPVQPSGSQPVPEVVPPRSTGPLKFTPGKVLTLREILNKVQRHVQKSISFDLRLANTTCFVEGEFGIDQFLAALRRVTSVEPVRVVEDPDAAVAKRISDLIRSTLGEKLQGEGWLKKLGVDALKSEQIEAHKLMEASPFMSHVLRQAGVDMNAQVKVRPAVAFTVDPGGSFKSRDGGNQSYGFIYTVY